MMDDPTEPPGPPARRTLKLKVPSTKVTAAAPRPASVTPASRPASTSLQPRDPGAWADVYKKKMQADMDALASGTRIEPHEPRKR